MNIRLHHVHIFSSDIEQTVAFYQQNFDGEVAFDGDFGGARNVFMTIGSGRLNIYEQPPRGETSGTYHHIGMQTDDLEQLYQRLLSNGVVFRSAIREFGSWRYLMCPAPDNMLLELFQIDLPSMPPRLKRFFGDGFTA
ncbi:MAG: VOC family protein [Pseudomonadota bacterium]